MQAQRIGALLIATVLAVLSCNIPFAYAQDRTIQELVDFARRNGHRQALGISACESLGLKTIGDCEVLQVVQFDGRRRTLNVFEEPGTGQMRIIILKELEGDEAVMCLVDSKSGLRAARRTRSNGADVWFPFSLELDPAVLIVLGEMAYWLKLATDSANEPSRR